MITVSTKHLVSAIEEAEAFRLPDMNEGVCYLYNELYRRLSEGSNLLLSEIDFDRFELDDIDFIRELHSGFEKNEGKAHTLIRALWGIPPATKASVFI